MQTHGRESTSLDRLPNLICHRPDVIRAANQLQDESLDPRHHVHRASQSCTPRDLRLMPMTEAPRGQFPPSTRCRNATKLMSQVDIQVPLDICPNSKLLLHLVILTAVVDHNSQLLRNMVFLKVVVNSPKGMVVSQDLMNGR